MRCFNHQIRSDPLENAQVGKEIVREGIQYDNRMYT